MSYDAALLERYALKAQELGQRNKVFGGSIEIDAVSDALGLPQEDGRAVAAYLHQLKWAEASFARSPPILTLTPLGYAEIAKLRLPAWRRWLDRHPTALAIIVSTMTTLTVTLASEFLKRVFWPPDP